MKEPTDWWKDAVVYQIYPRSFQDTNGDGVGDLPGIAQRLDYLQWLGVDTVWLSPVYRSPMRDFGYDISNYREIDPVFGTLEDFKHLLREAHNRGIRVLMDMVLNHTSDLHPWFEEARSSRRNPKRDWYIWHDGVNGRPPNNWLATFGGRAWEWDAATGQYYLHSFLKEQPDLNWRNPEMRRAAFDEMRYWLEMGVDGFRLDVINFIVKDEQLRSNPFAFGPTIRPYDLQEHRYDRNQPETHEILRELRKLLDSYDAMSVGEVYSPEPGDPAVSAAYLGEADELHLSFDFSLCYQSFNAEAIGRCLRRWYAQIPEGASACNVLSNHDGSRASSRLAAKRERRRAFEREKLLAALLLTLRGTPFLYYGEEIGIRDGPIKRSQIVDPLGKKYWPFHKGRDPCRTPMQWSEEPYSGFSHVEPWLPVNVDYPEVNVADERNDPSSLLSWYRSLLHLRRESECLRHGEIVFLDLEAPVIGYRRRVPGEECLVLLNFSARTVRLEPGTVENGTVLLGTNRRSGEQGGKRQALLAPYEAAVFSFRSAAG